jgi:beta-galactosidase
MAYALRIDETNAAVFSNCEQVRLWQDDGDGYRQVATQKPDASFIAVNGQEVNFALHHPPFTFKVASTAKALKAEGMIGGEVKATYEWRKYGKAAALTLDADRAAITADGADMSRIIVTAVDTNGVPVDNCNAAVSFKIDGVGQLIGENPLKLRAGKMIILAQSGFVPGEIRISAASIGLRSAETRVEMQPVGPNVDMPKDLTVKQPTKRFVASTPMAGDRPLPTIRTSSNP